MHYLTREFSSDLLLLIENNVNEDTLTNLISFKLGLSESDAKKAYIEIFKTFEKLNKSETINVLDTSRLKQEDYEKVINDLRLGQPSSIFATVGNKKYRSLIEGIDRSIQLNHHKVLLIDGDWGAGKTTLSKSLVDTIKSSAERYRLIPNLCSFNFPNSIKEPSSISLALANAYSIPLIEILSTPGAFSNYIDSIKNFPSGQSYMIKNLVKIHQYAYDEQELSTLIDDYLFSGRIQGLNSTIGKRSETPMDKPEWTLKNIAGDRVQHSNFLKFSIELQKHLGYYPIFVIDELDILAQRKNDRGMAFDWIRDIIDIATEQECGLIINSTPDVTQDMFNEYPAIEGRLGYDPSLPTSSIVSLKREDEDRREIVFKTIQFYLKSLDEKTSDRFKRLVLIFKSHIAYYFGQMTTWDAEYESLRVFLKGLIVELDHLRFKFVPSPHMLNVCTKNSAIVKKNLRRVIFDQEIEDLVGDVSPQSSSHKEEGSSKALSEEDSDAIALTDIPVNAILNIDEKATPNLNFTFNDSPEYRGLSDKSVDIFVSKAIDLVGDVINIAVSNKGNIEKDVQEGMIYSAVKNPEIKDGIIDLITVKNKIPLKGIEFDAEKSFEKHVKSFISVITKESCEPASAFRAFVLSILTDYEAACFSVLWKTSQERPVRRSLKTYLKSSKVRAISGLSLTLACEIAQNRLSVCFDGEKVTFPGHVDFGDKKMVIESGIHIDGGLTPLGVEKVYIPSLFQGIKEFSYRYIRQKKIVDAADSEINKALKSDHLYDIYLNMPIDSPITLLASLIVRKFALKEAFDSSESLILDFNNELNNLVKNAGVKPIRLLKSRNGLHLKADLSKKDGSINWTQIKDFKITLAES